jgi:2-polyprenyl-6-methoxyphenol hydroxylase-like FAD-dependent oxidoreductase
MRAVIIGAGIGGLAAAVALRRVGIDSLIVERFQEVREVGAGLSLWSNAVNALRELGVEARAVASASVMERIVTRTPAGRVIAVNDFAEISRQAGAPCICLRRAVLQRILLEQLPPDGIRVAARCAGFDDSTALLENGERIEADVLVGADGISSVIRDGLQGVQPPRYAGYRCWRGIVRGEGLLPDHTALLAAGAGSQFGLWPCGAGQFYWFLTANAPQGTQGTKADAVALCRDWAAPIPEVIAGTPEDAILLNDIVDRPPLRRWGRGRVTLLGDAAHATTPNLGQGACQALEDAVVLADCLRGIRPVEAALREYERLRIPRTAAIVRDSWQTGRFLHFDRPAIEPLRNWAMGTSLSMRLANRMFRTLLVHRLPKLQPPA